MTREPSEGTGGAVPFGDLFAIFQPGISHLVEEKERQRLDIVQREDGDPPWEIDLEAGTAVLRRPTSTQDTQGTQGTQGTQDAQGAQGSAG